MESGIGRKRKKAREKESGNLTLRELGRDIESRMETIIWNNIWVFFTTCGDDIYDCIFRALLARLDV